jgi:hypothetical protein
MCLKRKVENAQMYSNFRQKSNLYMAICNDFVFDIQ